MKLKFNKVWCKNFRSIDNMGMELDLTKAGKTLVTSLDNGQGKSTMISHAIYYALFDKAYGEDNKKTSLVNSRSNKECLVEVHFETLGSKWVVRRGMKPNVFDIEKDGVRVEDEAAIKDYQGFLTKTIGMDEKTFVNTVVLGKDRFVPFITMSAGDRRAYSEQMMNLVVFSQMNEVAKAELKVIKSDLSTVEYDIAKKATAVEGQKKLIASLKQTIEDKGKEYASEIAQQTADMTRANEMLEKLKAKWMEDMKNAPVWDSTKLTRLQQALSNANQQIRQCEHRIAQVDNTHECETCGQGMDATVKDRLTASTRETLSKLQDGVGKIPPLIAEVEEQKAKVDEHNANITKLQQAISTLEGKIQNYKSQIETLSRMGDASAEQARLATAEAELEAMNAELAVMVESEKKLMKDQTDHMHLLLMLKDDGVKASIIREYIPHLNAKVNEYLQDMNMFVNLSFDEEFGVEMFDPTRKGQTIGSLSSGQICRINLAVLLAWRDIAKAKASVDTNLMVFDEILESLSENGIQDFMGMYELKFAEGTNLFVVTQRKTEFEEYFDDTILFGMKDDHTIRIS